MKIWLRLLSLALLILPLAALYALQGPKVLTNLPAMFVCICCGAGLAAGVDSSAPSTEALLPQATSSTCRFKTDLGLTYSESDLVEHISELKYLSLLLFLLRLVVNIKALVLNVVAVCTTDLPVTVGNVARVFEAGIFLEHLCKLPCELVSLQLGASPLASIATVKTLAGFSSMRFLRFLNKRHILGALRQIAADRGLKGCALALLGVFYSLLVAAFGLAVLLSKLQRLDIRRMEELGVVGLAKDATRGSGSCFSFWDFMSSDLMLLVGFTNQVASAMNIEQEEMQRLLSFLLGDRSGEKGQRFLDQVMRNFMQLPRWRWRLVTMITFDAAGLQKLVRVRDRP